MGLINNAKGYLHDFFVFTSSVTWKTLEGSSSKILTHPPFTKVGLSSSRRSL